MFLIKFTIMIKLVIYLIYYLIKNKGSINIVMQEDNFCKDYYINKDNEDYTLQTTLIDLICDIYECNK